MKKVIILLSGGIDSVLLLKILIEQKYDIKALFFDYGQIVAKKEFQSASFFASFFNIPIQKIILKNNNIINIGAGKKGPRIIPNRNALFITMASFLFPHHLIAIGANRNDFEDYRDCRRSFFNQLEKLLNIKLLSPLILYSKKEIIEQFLFYNLPKKKTWSCYEAVNNSQCGTCNSCIENYR